MSPLARLSLIAAPALLGFVAACSRGRSYDGCLIECLDRIHKATASADLHTVDVDRLRAAVIAADEAIALEPAWYPAHFWRGYARTLAREFDLALEDLRRADELFDPQHRGSARPLQEDIWSTAAWCERERGNYERALEWNDRSKAAGRTVPMDECCAALSYRSLGRTEEAAACIERLQSNHAPRVGWLGLTMTALLQLDDGREAEALINLKRASELVGADNDSRFKRWTEEIVGYVEAGDLASAQRDMLTLFERAML